MYANWEISVHELIALDPEKERGSKYMESTERFAPSFGTPE